MWCKASKAILVAKNYLVTTAIGMFHQGHLSIPMESQDGGAHQAMTWIDHSQEIMAEIIISKLRSAWERVGTIAKKKYFE